MCVCVNKYIIYNEVNTYIIIVIKCFCNQHLSIFDSIFFINQTDLVAMHFQYWITMYSIYLFKLYTVYYTIVFIIFNKYIDIYIYYLHYYFI